MFQNDPDYVPSVFVFSNTTSNKDKQSRYERLLKRRRSSSQAATQKGQHVNSVATDVHRDEAAQDLATNDVPISTIEDNENNEESVTIEENVVMGEDKSVAKVDKNLSTDIHTNDWHAIEKKFTDQQELIEMLQNELRATRPSTKLQSDDRQVNFYTGFPSYSVFTALLHLLVGVI